MGSRTLVSMRSRRSEKRISVLMLVTVSVLMGLVVAGMAVPVTALGVGLAKTVSTAFSQVPAELTVPPQRENSRVLLADGSTLTDFFEENRQYVPLDQRWRLDPHPTVREAGSSTAMQ